MRIIDGSEFKELDTSGKEVDTPGPEMPAMVKASPVLSDLWRQFMHTLSEESLGNLTLADSWALEMLIRHLHVVRMASNEMIESGTVTVHDSAHDRLAKSPAESTMRFHSGAAMSIMKELRLTPKSRQGRRSDSEEFNPFV